VSPSRESESRRCQQAQRPPNPLIPRCLIIREIVTGSWHLMLQIDTPEFKTGFLSSQIRPPILLRRGPSGHPMGRRTVPDGKNDGPRGSRHMSRIGKRRHIIPSRPLTCNRPRLISRSGAPLRIFAALNLADVIGPCPSYARDRSLAEGSRCSEDSCLYGRAFGAGVVVWR